MAKKAVQARPARVIGYVRVSTAKQVHEGLSLEAQEAKLRSLKLDGVGDLRTPRPIGEDRGR